MFISGQKMWITLLYISLFLPQHCKAALEGMEISMESEMDCHNKLTSRRLLSETGSWDSRDFVIAVVILAVAFLILLLVIWCQKYVCKFGKESSEPLRVHPPPRPYGTSSHTSRSENTRPFASPMRHSSSLILASEEGSVSNIFRRMENPSALSNINGTGRNSHSAILLDHPPYNPAPYNASDQETNGSSTILQDFPPDYDTVVQPVLRNTRDIPNTSQKSVASSPPKYEDVITERQE